MSRWRTAQKELIENAYYGDKSGILQESVSSGKVWGTAYYVRNTKPKRGIVLVHGISGNRYALGEFAKILAAYGFFVLSIDLPSHYLNPNALTLGKLSETISEAVLLVKKFGINRVAVVSQSLGAVGTLFSSVGYNTEIEEFISRLWNDMAELFERMAYVLIKEGKGSNELNQIIQKIEVCYARIKEVIFYALKKHIQQGYDANCYIFLSPPPNCKKAMSGITLFRVLPKKLSKIIIKTLFHKPAVKLAYKEGNIVNYVPETDSRYVNWLFFKIKDFNEFIEYFLNMKEPADFLELVERFARFRHKDGKINFFEFYTKRYIQQKPKLFIYGKWDSFLRPLLPSNKKRIDKFYESWGDKENGNVKIEYGPYVHTLLEDGSIWKMRTASFNVTELKVNMLIIKFLDRNL